MIFNEEYDDRYKKWFAWYPVYLYGPDEWDRCDIYNCTERLVWLKFIWRYRHKPRPYYALPGPYTANKLLLDSVQGKETAFEKRKKQRLKSLKKITRPRKV